MKMILRDNYFTLRISLEVQRVHKYIKLYFEHSMFKLVCGCINYLQLNDSSDFQMHSKCLWKNFPSLVNISFEEASHKRG